MTILDDIVIWKQNEIAHRMRCKPLREVQAEAEQMPPPRDFEAALRAPGISLIAEIKRASPSKGAIRLDLNPADLARIYADNGAAAISVLTDSKYFGGSLDDLRTARQTVDLPLLRKDFVLDPYQVYEARAAGADAVLLIVAILSDPALSLLYALTRRLNMSALIEVHNENELQRALRLVPPLIGINNRDLSTFTVDLETTARLRPMIPADICVVAESGIHSRADLDRLRQIGVDAILVGEALVRSDDTGRQVRELIDAPNPAHSS